MSRPLFSISNHHVESCGEAPAVDGDAQGKYFGYFANEHAEQAVYTYDVDTREATLRMGDTGWQVVHPVVNASFLPSVTASSCSLRIRRSSST
jgi:hypothetical protein